MGWRSTDDQVSLPLILRLFILGTHLVVPIVAFFAITIGRPRFFGLLLYATLALLLFDTGFLLVSHREHSKAFQRTWITDARMATTLILGTVVAFALVGRGPVAYTLAAATGSVLTLRATTRKGHHAATSLSLICLFAATLLFARVLTVPYLATTFDTINHTAIIEGIIERGDTHWTEGTRYNETIVYHVLGASINQMTGIRPRIAATLPLIGGFIGGVVSLFAVIRYWSNSRRVAHVAAVLSVATGAFLVWGTKAHYQSLSFVYFVTVLLVLTKSEPGSRYAFVGFPVFLAWVNTHHFSIAMAVVLLSGPLVYAWWVKFGFDRNATITPVILLMLIVIKWTLLTNWFLMPFRWLLQNSPAARLTGDVDGTDVQVKSDKLYVEVFDSPLDIAEAAIPFFLDYSYLSFSLALAALGGVVILDQRRRSEAIFLACALFAGIFYFPNPAWWPLRGFVVLQRWSIMSIPLVIGIISFGVLVLFRGYSTRVTTRERVQTGFVIIFVFLLMFTSISSGFYEPTTSNFAGEDRYDRKYLSNADIATSDWIRAQTEAGHSVYITSKLVRYTEVESGQLFHKNQKQVNYRRARVTGPTGTFLFPPGLTVIQVEAFRESSVKVAFSPNASYYPSDVDVKAPVNDRTVEYDANAANLVYTNGQTVVHESSGPNGEQER